MLLTSMLIQNAEMESHHLVSNSCIMLETTLRRPHLAVESGSAASSISPTSMKICDYSKKLSIYLIKMRRRSLLTTRLTLRIRELLDLMQGRQIWTYRTFSVSLHRYQLLNI